VRTFLYRAGAALFSAAAMVGLFVVTRAPLTLRDEIAVAVAAGIAVQLYIEWYVRRSRAKIR
jgi:hypothetical protein